MDAHIELIAAAFACDLTRVASFQYLLGENDANPYPWLGINDGHHNLTHAADSDAASWEKVAQIRVWYAEKFALLLDRLDAIPEGDGTLLDNCMVVWGSRARHRQHPLVQVDAVRGRRRRARRDPDRPLPRVQRGRRPQPRARQHVPRDGAARRPDLRRHRLSAAVRSPGCCAARQLFARATCCTCRCARPSPRSGRRSAPRCRRAAPPGPLARA